MSHQFEVGKQYRNRTGLYVVETIDGNSMKIRYVENGATLETSVNVQARIWENIQFEKQMARSEERRRQAQEARQALRRSGTRTREAPVRPAFEGFQAGDFETKERGIAWAGRRDLGRLLAYEMNRRSGEPFEHFIVPYQSEVHVARGDRYDREARETNAAFFVSTSETAVSYGFHVGKPAGKVKPRWPWAMLLAALSADEGLRNTLRSSMEQRGLSLVVFGTTTSYGQVGRVTVEEGGFVWRHEDPGQDVTREMTGKQLADYLETITPEKRADIYVGQQVPKAEAIAAGAKIVTQILTVYEALLSLHDASAGSARG
jgi:hypothetical protein